ncbi:glycosyltransferase involved in cell wall biosynthesis [Dyadobacter jejuensis]|uniref:Glycosyltransferase involved in cell wall biosynthesis n=1 Tax=Dyadobacter jejuensis TaxID=1082580 RepID=A0A316AQC5_9BACT|nr:glycosyltransferase family 4 protein [Dyadobacter jejuensis]PWJ59933.1 glycosyltransferase involved in cell wall biosynthesis [Dyadobacter jejuensis]
MHVLLVHQYFLDDQQGGGARWNEMARIWVGMGHQVTVLAGDRHYMAHSARRPRAGCWQKSRTNDGVLVWWCRAMRPKPGLLGRLLEYLSFMFTGSWAGLFLARDRYDLVVCTSPPLLVGLVGLLIGRVKRLPMVFEVRDLWPESAMETGVLTNKWMVRWALWLEKVLYQSAHSVVVLTPAFKRILSSEKGVPLHKLICIPNGANFALADLVSEAGEKHRTMLRSELGISERFVIVYLGAHGEANYLEGILEVAHILLQTPVLFLLIGDGARKEALQLEAKKRNLTNILFLNPCPRQKALAYVRASDMGLSILQKVPVFGTIYSNKTFDYLSCRTPVLMAIDGLSRELIEKANAGVYVDAKNPLDIASKIRHCMQEPELLKKWGESGYRYAKLNFDREVLTQLFLDHLKSIIRKENHIKPN